MRSPIVLLACLAWLASPAGASVNVQLVVNVRSTDIQHGDGREGCFSWSSRSNRDSQRLTAPAHAVPGHLGSGDVRRRAASSGWRSIPIREQWFFFAHRDKPAGNTVIARYHVSASVDVADPNPRSPSSPSSNRSESQRRTDTALTASSTLGDGGAAGDPPTWAAPHTLLELLRIDDRPASPTPFRESLQAHAGSPRRDPAHGLRIRGGSP